MLSRLYGKIPSEIENEIEYMELEVKNSTQKLSMWSVLRERTYFLPLVLVCFLQGGLQLSGVNAVTYYSVLLFESTGMSSTNAKWANLATGVVNLLVAFCNPIIMATFNRRPVVILSYFFTAIFMTLLIIIISISVRFVFCSIISCKLFVIYNYIVKHLGTWLSYASIGAVILYLCAFQIGIAPTGFFIASGTYFSPYLLTFLLTYFKIIRTI